MMFSDMRTPVKAPREPYLDVFGLKAAPAGQRLQHAAVDLAGGHRVCVAGLAAYRPGDVVLFSRNGRLFVHRVVEMSGGAVVTRGDSMLDADPPVAVSDVLGRVESIERGGSPPERCWGSRGGWRGYS